MTPEYISCVAAEVFAAHPSLNELVITADGQAFDASNPHSVNVANRHAEANQLGEVHKVSRQDLQPPAPTMTAVPRLTKKEQQQQYERAKAEAAAEKAAKEQADKEAAEALAKAAEEALAKSAKTPE